MCQNLLADDNIEYVNIRYTVMQQYIMLRVAPLKTVVRVVKGVLVTLDQLPYLGSIMHLLSYADPRQLTKGWICRQPKGKVRFSK